MSESVDAVVARLAAVEAAACDRVALSELVVDSLSVRAFLDELDARLATAIGRLGVHGWPGWPPAYSVTEATMSGASQAMRRDMNPPRE